MHCNIVLEVRINKDQLVQPFPENLHVQLKVNMNFKASHAVDEINNEENDDSHYCNYVFYRCVL